MKGNSMICYVCGKEIVKPEIPFYDQVSPSGETLLLDCCHERCQPNRSETAILQPTCTAQVEKDGDMLWA